MSGIVKIRDNIKWMPSGWAFDYALQRIADEMKTIDPSLSTILIEVKTDVGIGYCDLRSLDNEQFYHLVQATELAYKRILMEGETSFHLPQYYAAFMSLFEEFKMLLDGDVRVEFSKEKMEIG